MRRRIHRAEYKSTTGTFVTDVPDTILQKSYKVGSSDYINRFDSGIWDIESSADKTTLLNFNPTALVISIPAQTGQNTILTFGTSQYTTPYYILYPVLSQGHYLALLNGSAANVVINDPSHIQTVINYGITFRAFDFINRALASGQYADPAETTIPEGSVITLTAYNDAGFLPGTLNNAKNSWELPIGYWDEPYNIEFAYITNSSGLTLAGVEIPALAWDFIPSTQSLIPITLGDYGIYNSISLLYIRAFHEYNGFIVPSNWSGIYVNISSYRPVISDVSPGSYSIVLGTSDLTISWAYAHQKNRAQAQYTLRYSADGGETWTDYAVRVANTDNSVTIPANTLPTGTVKFELYVYETPGTMPDSLHSNTLSFTYLVKAQPSTSTVTCDNKPVPTVSWTSAAQAAYQVRISGTVNGIDISYDTGAVFGSATTHTASRVFDDGVYAVTMRTQTDAGDWSDWTDPIFAVIANTPPADTVSLAGAVSDSRAILTATPNGSFAGLMWYRDGLPRRCSTASRWADAEPVGEHTYFVRALTDDGNYAQSETLTLDVALPCDLISGDGGDTWQYLLYTLQSPHSIGRTRTAGVQYKHYAGRALPVAVTDGSQTQTVTAAYAFEDAAGADAVASLAGKQVLYKSRRAGSFRGVVTDTATTDSVAHEVSFTVAMTDSQSANNAFILVGGTAVYASAPVSGRVNDVSYLTYAQVQALINDALEAILDDEY